VAVLENPGKVTVQPADERAKSGVDNKPSLTVSRLHDNVFRVESSGNTSGNWTEILTSPAQLAYPTKGRIQP